MQIYNNSDNGTLYQGDCLEVLRWLPSDSMDTMITDPPYGLSFMGKKWDYEVPSVDVWKECLRVLKPGATALIFAGSRTQHRMAVNVEDAGFILKDTIMWIYGSGFPKSTDISKQLDKIAGAEREVIGSRLTGGIGRPTTTGQKEGISNSNHSSGNIHIPITVPATNEAKTWNGWGTALKPAYEPILVAMKPNDGTYAQNAMKWGVAGLNIDGGRIEVEPDDPGLRPNSHTHIHKNDTIFTGNYNRPQTTHLKGRFPANIILDEEAGRLLDEQSGILKSGSMEKGVSVGFKSENCYQKGDGNISNYTVQKNSGGASRFFYCAKASKSGKNAGCEDLLHWYKSKRKVSKKIIEISIE